MRRTSYVRRRSRMHQFDLIITECIGCCKFFNSSNDRFSNPDAHANRFSRNSRLDLVLRSRDRLSILRRI